MNEAEKERFSLVKQVDEIELGIQKYAASVSQAKEQYKKLKSLNEKGKFASFNPIEYRFLLFLSY